MSKEQNHFYEFGAFRMEPGRRLLLRDNRPSPKLSRLSCSWSSNSETVGSERRSDEVGLARYFRRAVQPHPEQFCAAQKVQRNRIAVVSKVTRGEDVGTAVWRRAPVPSNIETASLLSLIC
jgi:hypothetical protein